MDPTAEGLGYPGPGEGTDGSTEPSSCQELLHRLRELEAENSALAQANENQRETYERCLDEVANHVVQALLNQKDLREECIKLKKRVFDLERQNQMLSALFQQKLQLTTGSLPQIPLTPIQVPSEPPASPSLGTTEGPATSLPLGNCAGQREVCWEQQLRPGGPGPPAAPPPALDALSPFLRKKAQILEVLRALEETDPLLLCSPTTPWQPAGHGPGSPEPINGELCGPPQAEPSPWAPYLLVGPGNLGGLLHWERLLGGPGEEDGTRRPWGANRASPQAQGTHCTPGSSSSSSSDEAGDPNEAPSPDTLLGALARRQLNLGQLLEDTETYLQAFLAGAAGPLSGDHPGPGQPSSPDQGPPQLSKSKGLPKSAWGGGSPEAQRLGFGATSEGQGPLPFLSVFAGTEDAALGSQPGHPHSSSQVKSKLQMGPPSPGEAQGPLLPSPARSLKFLKLPPASEKVPSPGGPQLSPQLPRSSRIPCRNSGSDGSPSPLLARRGLGGELSPEGTQGLSPSPSPCPTTPDSAQLKPPQSALSTTLSPGPVVSPCYENILDLSRGTFRGSSPEPPPSPLQVPTYPQLALEVPQAPEGLRSPRVSPSPCLSESCPYGSPQEKSSDKAGSESPHPGRRTPGSSSKKPGQGSGRRAGDPGYTPLRDRLAALGKLKTGPEGPLGPEKNGVPARPGMEKARGPGRSGESTGDMVPPTARPLEQPETKGALRGAVALGTSSLKQQEPALGDPGARVYSSHSMGARVDLEPVSPRSCLTKVELARSRLAGALCPQVPRTPAKVPPAAPSLGKPSRSPHSSPTKLPSKSPTKVVPRPGPSPVTKEPTKPDKGKGSSWADCSSTTGQLTSPVPGTPNSSQVPEGSAPHSAIEEKVMKGIEENVLRLQGQERAPAPEAKHRSASSIASWFGLKKSKLPALNRRTEATKSKEGAGGGSPLRKEVKVESRKLEAESLNISKLMAKAEDLRRALEEEKAYLSSRTRPRPGGPATGPGPGLGQVQGQLVGMYHGADTFMQQLLNRVDGKELPPKSWRETKPEYGDFQPVSSDPKSPWPACGPRNGLVGPPQGCGKPGKPSGEPGRQEEIPSEDGLAEPVPTSHFTACSSLTRTLDSGIGTFPPPDHGSGGTPSKNLPKAKPARLEPPPGVPPARPPALTKVPRRAHTLEREVPGIEELLVSGRHPSMPAFPALLTATPSRRGHLTCPDDPCEDPGPPPAVQLAKNWTFPNTRAAGSSSDAFLCPPRHLEGLPRTPMALPVDRKQSLEPSRPPPTPQGPVFGGSRTPSTSDMGEEGRAASGGAPGLETSESLSDSLYDSLSSCGSQG
ncbi:PREDICTED: nck-associated protein 5-like isoform X2 [Chinchilla lanigera]|nr:PREDICTED: nck-associated protein 5-like isoform X2 [Chinchilla lanigera]XP_013363930.1 PREDICTED: nck-associated protein 5-like isoform X2 [Chinchilla lanigera]XP_013363931.1 PREDICTED: nck-associated protein 5-like isoform X2 [Chinchilla lanigera]XP_013363932.1 PREDICTED: nck-associated protein 5-like isoform X2 [Chinchilla lanigera]